jgi:replicative DNA helicase
MSEPQALPFSEESEKCLLCCLCLSKDDLVNFGPLLPVDAFYIPAHRIVIRALRTILAKDMDLDFAILKHVIKVDDELEEVGGGEGLVSIWNYLHFAAGTVTHFESVKSLYQARVTIVEALSLIQTLRDPKLIVADTVQDYVERVLTKISISTKVEEKPFKALVWEAYEELEKRTQSPKISGITFGIRSLDMELYGIQPMEKCVIAGETGGGKSALASQAVIQNALDGKSTAVFSLEMSPMSLIHRMFANVGPVSMTSMKRGKFHDHEVTKLECAVRQLVEFKIHLDPARDISEIVSRSRYLKNKHDINLIIVDYVQLVGSKFANNSERHERFVANVIHTLSGLAGELRVAIIAMSQLNDDGYLRDSRAIGHDADIVLKIENCGEEESEAKQINVQKQRNGEQGKIIPVTFEGQYMRFTERAEEMPPPTMNQDRNYSRNYSWDE